MALLLNSRIAHNNSVKEANNSLINLRNDIERDQNQFKRFWIPRLEKQFEARKRLTNFLENDNIPIVDSLQFVIDIQLISTYFTFDQNKSALEDLFNSNGLKLIKDRDLLEELLEYKRNLENMTEIDIIQRTYFLDLYSDLTVNIVGGLALQEDLTVSPKFDKMKMSKSLSKALNVNNIRDSGYLRKLLVATGLPMNLKNKGYNGLQEAAKNMVAVIDKFLNTNSSGK